jgi:hypothetical protein
MNPLSLIFSWDTVVVAVAASVLTQLAKLGIDYLVGIEQSSARARLRSGADVRKHRPALSKVALPVLPLFFGFVLGAILPLGPDVLIAFAGQTGKTGVSPAVLFGAWGLVAGLLGDYVYTHIHDAWRAVQNHRAG